MLASLFAGLASGQTAAAISRARSAAIAYSLVALATLCGTGFLIGAFYIWLADRLNPLQAALSIGGGFILLAVIILIVHKVVAGRRARRQARKRKSELAAAGLATAVAILPTLLRSKIGLGALIGPALALAAFAIYKENSGSGSDPLDD